MIKQIADIIYAEAKNRLAPFHYREMIEQAIKKYAIDNRMPKYSAKTDVMENVRNKLHYQDKRFHHYHNGWFGLTEWHVKNGQLLLFNDYFRISMKPGCIMSALYEAYNREPHMLNKHNHNKIKHFWNIIIGFIIEHHIKDWFQQKFHDCYLPPENENDYTKPALNDWKLKIGDKLLLFDVKRHCHRTDIEAYRTKDSRIFVLADIDGTDIVVYGFTTARWLKRFANVNTKQWYDGSIKKYYIVTRYKLYPFAQLQVYLNCLRMNIDFELIDNVQETENQSI